jgi:hypothetical protein
MRLYVHISIQRQSPRHMSQELAEKSVKGALNLQDLRSLTIFIYIIYLYTILLRFRPPELKSIYLLWEHHTKSIAKSSYSLPTGEGSWQSNVPPRRHPAISGAVLGGVTGWAESPTRSILPLIHVESDSMDMPRCDVLSNTIWYEHHVKR